MSRLRPTLETAHILALGVWLGALVMTGATAAIAFPTMRDLDPSLPAFAAYPEDHCTIAAGMVMARVFFVCDTVQLVGAMVASVTLIGLFATGAVSRRRAAHVIRAAILAALAVSLLQYLIFPAREMAQHLDAFWTAARAGDIATADAERAAFDRLHPGASLRLSLHAIGIVAALVVGCWAATTPATDVGVERAEAGA
ncbi:MAG: hypothetical protein ACF8QF_11680 [Phycisphaerales bacterium]